MDIEKLIELGKRLGLRGNELEQWVLEEQTYWREEEALEREAKAREKQALKELAEITKEIAAKQKERDEHVRARMEIEKENFHLRLRLGEIEGTGKEAPQPKNDRGFSETAQTFSQPSSSPDQFLLRFEEALDASNACELDVTSKCQVVPNAKQNTKTIGKAQAVTSHFTVPASAALEADVARASMEDILPPEHGSVAKKSPVRDEKVPKPLISVPNDQVASKRKHPLLKLSRHYSSRAKSRNSKTKRKNRSTGKQAVSRLTSGSRNSKATTRRIVQCFPRSVRKFSCAREPYNLNGKLMNYVARRVYRRGREWHRSHCRKRDKLPS